MYLKFNNAYLAAKLDWIDRSLKTIPIVHKQKHRDKYVIRYRDYGKLRQVCDSHSKYRELEGYYSRSQNLKSIRNQLSACITDSRQIKIRTGIKAVFNRNDYDRMVPKTDNNDGYHPYRHKEFYMRSRFEVAMAAELDNLGLEYKYEPTFRINGYQFSPDFVIYIPEYDCCIIVECEGMTDEVSYVNRNGVKFAEYLYIGLVFGMTLVVLQGTKESMPSPELMRNSVISAINLLSSYYTV
ncbi:MAG: hypothetical protein IJ757_08330 [Clostridiales bacterium]|nr:hypothetical protein [Clostridiales bacterium]